MANHWDSQAEQWYANPYVPGNSDVGPNGTFASTVTIPASAWASGGAYGSQGGSVSRSMFDGPFERPSMSREEAFKKVCMDVLKGFGIAAVLGLAAAIVLYELNSDFRHMVDQKMAELFPDQPAAE